jgi:hypothetical protein
MGARRVGCFPCINSRKAEIRAMAKYRPERIAFLADQERRVGKTNFGLSTFFHRMAVPEQFRRQQVEIDGVPFAVADIHDVVDWAQTARGGRQYDMDFEDADLPLASACDIGGMCE